MSTTKTQRITLEIACPLGWADPAVWAYDYIFKHGVHEAERVSVKIVDAEPVDAPEARFYAVGLPVIFTVHPDGTVTHEVDLSEAAEAAAEEGATDEDVAAIQSYIAKN